MPLFRLYFVAETVTYLRVCSRFGALSNQKMDYFHLQKRNLNTLLIMNALRQIISAVALMAFFLPNLSAQEEVFLYPQGAPGALL